MKFKIKSEKFDIWLGRFSHIAQIILVCVAVFGYFYTIRPIYQNQLLSEDIAKKELELRKIIKELDYNKNSLQIIKDSIKIITNAKDELIKKLRSEYFKLSGRTIQLEDEFIKKEKIIGIVAKDLMKVYTLNYIERVSLIALTKVNKNFSYDEVRNWIQNYQENLSKILENSIQSSYGYGQNYGEERIPDSTLQKLKLRSIEIIKQSRNVIFDDKVNQVIKDLFTKSQEIETDCNIEELYRERNEIMAKTKSANNIDEKLRLSKIYNEKTKAISDCNTRIGNKIYEMEVLLKSLITSGIQESTRLLLTQLTL
jgi:hypothetical protein